jgi:hypothetical protein
MTSIITKLFIGLIAVSLLGGCATHSTPQNTAALDVVVRDAVNADNYKTVNVLPFTVDTSVNITDPKFAENFSADIAARLRYDHPGIFQEVSWNKVRQIPGEAIVTGTIRKYDPGSHEVRRWIGGIFTGAAIFEGEMVIKDAQNGKVILSAPFDKVWAWGGSKGADRTIDHLIAETAVAISKTVALWKQGQLSR